MKKCILLLLLSLLSVTGFAQRNRIHLGILGVDNVFRLPTDEDLAIFGGLNASLGFTRSLGSRITLGLSYHIFLPLNEVRIDENNNNGTYYIGAYNENSRHGFVYECKYFLSNFNIEAEGGYISSLMSVNIMEQKQEGDGDYMSYGPINLLPTVNNNYTAYRYGFKIGYLFPIVDISIGYIFNLGTWGRTTDNLFYKGLPTSTGNFVFNYSFGFNF